MRPLIQWALLSILVVSGCATNAADRVSLDHRSQMINDQVDFLKSAGEPYGSEGIPNVRFQRRGGIGPWSD